MIRKFNTNPIAVEPLLREIDMGALALPEFQRDFVWVPEATASLLVSISQGYPAGSLLVWTPNEVNAIRMRAFSGAQKLDSSAARLVLDGQQRLTSLFQTIYGQGEYRFFLNLKALEDEEPDLNDLVVFYPKEQAKALGLDIDRHQFQGKLFPFSRLRDGFDGYSRWCFDRARHAMTPEDEGAGSYFDYSLTRIGNAWVRTFLDYQFPVIELTREAGIDAVCHIFEKLNSTGQPLTLFELLTARFWVKGLDLREKWRAACTVRGGILSRFELEPIDLLRVVAFLAQIPDAHKPDAIFKLTSEQLKLHWDRAVNGLAAALGFMQHQFGALTPKLIPYSPMVTPLAALFGAHPNIAARPTAQQSTRLHQWYWCSVFGGVYVQGAATRSLQDYRALSSWVAAGESEEPEAVRTFEGFRPERLFDLTRQGQAEYKACIGLLVRRNPRDLMNGEHLVDPKLDPVTLHRRFIFPRKHLNYRFPKELCDGILNITLSRPRVTGLSANEWPSKYLKTAERNSEVRLNAILPDHLLPAGANSSLARDDFYAFLMDRMQLFAEEIAEMTGKACLPTEIPFWVREAGKAASSRGVGLAKDRIEL